MNYNIKKLHNTVNKMQISMLSYKPTDTQKYLCVVFVLREKFKILYYIEKIYERIVM
jgi:hypothetical protein